MTLLERYLAGENEQVWEEITSLGTDYWDKQYHQDVRAVAAETMTRVGRNLEIIRTRLENIGYIFAIGNSLALRSLTDDDRQGIAELERLFGPLPLSLRIFYDRVGAVDFRQAEHQNAHYSEEIEGEPLKMENLGRQDPLVVGSPLALLNDCIGFRKNFDAGRIKDVEPGFLELIFAPDEFHKAFYSGGPNYGVRLPCNEPDFFITGMYGFEETFVQHLRNSLKGGGFRGAIILEENGIDATKPVPTGPLFKQLTEGLEEI